MLLYSGEKMNKNPHKYQRVEDLHRRGIFMDGKRPPVINDQNLPQEEKDLLAIVVQGMSQANNPFDQRNFHLCAQAKSPVFLKYVGETPKIKHSCGFLEGSSANSKVLSRDGRCIYSGCPYEHGYHEHCPILLDKIRAEDVAAGPRL